jgi:oxygen-independent coproporphyrinogen III oxidase
MKFAVEIDNPKQLANIEAALKIIDPSARISQDNPDFKLHVSFTPDFLVRVRLTGGPGVEASWEYADKDRWDPRYNNQDRQQRVKELIRRGIITLLGKLFNRKPPWGILSGVRPTKIFHHLRDKGFSVSEIRESLSEIYGMADGKAELLVEVGEKQEKFFKPKEWISIYLGIPFCPTRCHYCSFPAVSLETHHHLLNNYLAGLQLEIDATAQLCRELGFRIETIYVGGGTPTSLAEASFSRVISSLAQQFRSVDTIEFTVEAGRPETVSAGKLKTMADAGVNRISINPQTMSQRTLVAIGRNHTVEDVYQAVNLVRRYPNLSLNMDLILGLPGEDGAVFLQSLTDVLQFAPENITIHTLAPKRAAAWRKNFSALPFTGDEDLAGASETACNILRNHGYAPYYLYRQRYILADQENIGYALPGKESIYNIQMMEERQTIFGLGGGAVTKWVTGADYQVFREQNPKCPAAYYSRLNGQVVKKAQQTRLLLG